MEAKLKRQNGTVKIDIDGKLYTPLSFKSFRPSDKNISDFYDAGLRLFSILTSGLNSMLTVPYSLFGESWVGFDTYDFEPVDKQIDMFIKNAPDAYFALMFQLDTRPWYMEAENCPNTFWCLSQMAGNEKWRKEAAKYLKAIITHVEEKYGEKFYGYFLLCGTTTEWFSDRDYFAPHDLKLDSYRKFTGKNVDRLPTPEEICKPAEQVFYTEEDKEIPEYVKYHCEIIADAICYFAAEAQSVIKHKKLLGMYYGYLFELASERVWNAGSLAYKKVYDCPDIDMISSPSSYAFRKHIDPSAFMVTFDSLDMRDKLYYLEFDHITHLSPTHVENILIPGGDSKFANEQETMDVMRRDFALTTSKGAALWWFDMFEGWFYSDGMMGEVKKMIEIGEKLQNINCENVSEIAVFADGESLYGVNKCSKINNFLLCRQRKGLSYLGAPYDVFDTNDLTKINLDKYKMLVFIDALDMTDENRNYIENTIKKSGKTVVWSYAPDYVKGGIDGISKITGINVEKYKGDTALAVYKDEKYGFKVRYNEMFTSDDGEVIAYYEDSDVPAVVKKDCGGFVSVYSALGDMPFNLLKDVARDAGVFIYSDTTDLVYVNSSIVSVCSDTDGAVTVNMPKDVKFEEMFDGGIYETKDGKLDVNMRRGEVKMYKIIG